MNGVALLLFFCQDSSMTSLIKTMYATSLTDVRDTKPPPERRYQPASNARVLSHLRRSLSNFSSPRTRRTLNTENSLHVTHVREARYVPYGTAMRHMGSVAVSLPAGLTVKGAGSADRSIRSGHQVNAPSPSTHARLQSAKSEGAVDSIAFISHPSYTA